MDIQTLRNFLMLSDTLNFTRASQQSFIVQSALSKQIKQLEQELSVTLFKRDKRNVSLTPAGKSFKNDLAKIISHLDHSISKTRQLHLGQAGELRIGYTHSAMQSFLPSLIATINKKFPEMKTILMEMTNTHQSSALKNREIDVSISPNPIVATGVKSKVVLEDNFALVLPLSHPLDNKTFEDITQFSEESFILPPKTEGTLYVSIVESIFTDAGFLPAVIHETPYANTGIRLVQGGLGITIEPAHGLSGYSDIKVIELTQIRQKAEHTMLWLPEFEDEFPEIFTLLYTFKYV